MLCYSTYYLTLCNIGLPPRHLTSLLHFSLLNPQSSSFHPHPSILTPLLYTDGFYTKKGQLFFPPLPSPVEGRWQRSKTGWVARYDKERTVSKPHHCLSLHHQSAPTIYVRNQSPKCHIKKKFSCDISTPKIVHIY